jgi:NAD(P)H-hydrate epimerase
MRAIDRWAIGTIGIPSVALMENAGRGVADVILDEPGRLDGPVAVVCGPGNNGGDGFVAARHLRNAGVDVLVLLNGRTDAYDRDGDAGTNFRVVRRMGIPVVEAADAAELRRRLTKAAIVVDALYGTGLSRPVEGPAREAIEAVNGAGRPVLAVDIPSGLDADTGQPLGAAVRAAITATMAFPKRGFRAGRGPVYCGTVRVIDIGLPRDVPEWDATEGRLRV